MNEKKMVGNPSGMDLEELQANWDKFGKTDPLWSIITAPSKRGGRWDADEFFATGCREIAAVMAYVQSLGVVLRKGRALDFGCGVGRLTQALCAYFAACDGVDIAPSMIELARRYNKFGEKCRYHLNEVPNLSLFADNSFEFIYSSVTLQHMRPDYSAAYLKEFLRVLAPGGLAVFQLPGELVESGTLSRMALDAMVESHRRMFELVGSDKPGHLIAGAAALPASGLKAHIRLGKLPAILPAGASCAITAWVKNTSECAWLTRWMPDGRFSIQLGNHWLDASGNMLQDNDGRTPLPHDLQPGQEAEMSLVIRAPAAAGAYILEVDMVQEGVAWFKSHGSATAVASLEIQEGRMDRQAASTPQNRLLRRGKRMVARLLREEPSPQNAEHSASSPVMELHGIPRARVIALLEAAGGRLVDVQRYDVCGPAWKSYRYSVMK
jgi:SAM-dependent methyltransferase